MSYVNAQTAVQTPEYSGSYSNTTSSLQGSALSTPQTDIESGGSGMVYIMDGTGPEIGLQPALWSKSDGDEFEVKEPKEVYAINPDLISPPSSECEQDDDEMVDIASPAYSNLTTTVNQALQEDSTTNEIDFDAVKNLKLDTEWLGTSKEFAEQVLYIQVEDHTADQSNLKGLIAWRQSLVQDLSRCSSDPAIFIDLSSVDNKLGYTDTGVAHAYKALLLIEACLKVTKFSTFPKLGELVRSALKLRLRTSSSIIIEDNLENMRLEAYQFLLDGLRGCGALWDGLQEATKALKIFPSDPELLELRSEMLATFKEDHRKLVASGCKPNDIKELSRSAGIFQKTYPWMDKSLFWRTPALVREVNKSFGSNAEVRRAFWGTPEQIAVAAKNAVKEGEDVGALGIFATRDIEEGETIIVDKTLLGISDVVSSTLEWCDACHASLRMPYLSPKDIRKPKCCKKVAYCSQECLDTAVTGYHSVLCGKDFDWVYHQSLSGASDEKGECGSRWRPIMFTRLMAIILADMKSPKYKNTHPLQHPLVARMAANYPPPGTMSQEMTHQWQFFENVVAPTQILLQFGVDVFKSPIFTQEVVQTIYWRLENNANMSNTELVFSTPTGPVKGQKVENVNVNPNYLLFNHSCANNVEWHGGAVPDAELCIAWLRNGHGGIEKAGCSAVFCSASRDVKKGEELKISYIGDPLGKDDGGALERVGREGKRLWLEKWFSGGCGCAVCENENEDGRKSQEAVR